ncbi:hypothetical protein [Hyphomicrobium sulfonivorans]|uniref:hypothetical protein n=1 Tax=Hyphomicrobium sulfonivorans TaxID=121290 RepID=UPI001FE97172|nr:hypothetical protein [Hyphomicrobium sulfonivorans]
MKLALLAFSLLFGLAIAQSVHGEAAPASPVENDFVIEFDDEDGDGDDDGASAVEEAAPPSTPPAPIAKEAPFKALPGRWVGDGRIGIKDGKPELVKCRATYFVNDAGDELRQNIRCASAGGKVEIKSSVVARKGKVTGTWEELMYNMRGDMAGEVTERGFRIKVAGDGLSANMDVIVVNDRQIVEIQFFNSSLRGLVLILKKG